MSTMMRGKRLREVLHVAVAARRGAQQAPPREQDHLAELVEVLPAHAPAAASQLQAKLPPHPLPLGLRAAAERHGLELGVQVTVEDGECSGNCWCGVLAGGTGTKVTVRARSAATIGRVKASRRRRERGQSKGVLVRGVDTLESLVN
ncbi:unnamed protein product [Pedinophyceae sp. YPF-701]|nr:unnamed protein product [Pedinophyceae sp. YPF-701]